MSKISLEKQLTFRKICVHLTQSMNNSYLIVTACGFTRRDGFRKPAIATIQHRVCGFILIATIKINSFHKTNSILLKRKVLVDFTVNHKTNSIQQTLFKNVFSKSPKS